MIEEHLQASSLCLSTRQGLFLAHSGERFWVFTSFSGRYAVRLDASPSYPQFMAHQLGPSAIATGALLRPITFKRGPAVDQSFRGRCGIIGTSGIRNFIKVIDDEGHPMRLVLLPDVLKQHCRYTLFFPNWTLQVAIGPGLVPVFQSASEPPRIRAPLIAPPPGTIWTSPGAYLPDTKL